MLHEYCLLNKFPANLAFSPPGTTDNVNNCCKIKMNAFWFWHGSELANLLRKFSVTWCGATAGVRSQSYVKAAGTAGADYAAAAAECGSAEFQGQVSDGVSQCTRCTRIYKS